MIARFDIDGVFGLLPVDLADPDKDQISPLSMESAEKKSILEKKMQ